MGSRIAEASREQGGVSFLTGKEPFATSFGDTMAISLGLTQYRINGENLAIPAVWDLSRQGVAFVEIGADLREHSGVESLVENTILQFLSAYPGASKRVMVCDRTCSARIISFVTALAAGKNCSTLFTNSSEENACPVYTSAEDAVRALGRLPITERIAATGGQLFAYNRKNPENVQPPTLVVLRGMASSLNYMGQEQLRGLLQNGSKAGIYFLVVDTSAATAVLSVDDKVLHYTFDPKKNAITDPQTGDAYSVELRAPSFSLENFCAGLAASVGASAGAIFYDSLDRTRSSKDFSEVLSVPIGKENGRPVVLELSSKSTAAHCIVSGMTGSGKSVLLHDIILGLTRTYTPAELELWLFDFKVGAEFSPYEKLKHVRRMALNNKARDAADLMNDILRQMQARHSTITEAGANDIVSYNAKMRASGRPLMSRLLIVIDEYTVMKNLKCISDFELVALQGRSAGISFIISSQIHDSMFKRITDQAAHKFEFRNKTLGVLIPSLTDHDGAFLLRLPGNCAYHDGTRLHRMRAAYTGDADGVRRLIEENNRIHGGFAYKKPLIMGSVAAIGTRTDGDGGEDGEEIRAGWKKNRQILFPLGQSRDGEEVSFFMGRERTHVLLLGDEARCANVEHTMATRTSALDYQNNVFYLDFYKSADRLPNVIADADAHSFAYARTNKDIGGLIKELYSVYLAREEALDNGDPVGEPILLFIHGTEFLGERAKSITAILEKETSRKKTTSFGGSSFLSTDEDAERILNQFWGTTEETAPADNGESDAWKMISTVVSHGGRCRIYTALHFENAGEVRSVTDRLFSQRNPVRDTVILPPRMRGEKTVSVEYITKYLSSAGVGTSDFDKESEINAAELLYGYLTAGTNVTRFIPYEEE